MLLECAKMHQVAVQNEGRQPVLDRFFCGWGRLSYGSSQLLQNHTNIRWKAGDVVVYGLGGCLISLHRRHELLFLAVVGDEIELRARDALELCRAFYAGKVVADAEGVTLEFVDRGESLALVRSFGAGNGHTLGPAGGIERVCALVGFASDEDFILPIVEFEADALQDGIGHGLSAHAGPGLRAKRYANAWRE